MSSCSSSITDLLSALCDCSLSGVSWKRRALGGTSKESFHRTLKKRAYGALLSKIFQDGSKGSASRPNATANTPARNKVIMMCFDLRVAGCCEEAEKLEEQLERLPEGASSGLKELEAVLELLVFLAGSAPPPPTSFSRDYMRRERLVQRKPQPWSYQSEELQRLEARAWGLVCAEEWGTLETLCGTHSFMDALPGTGLLALRTKSEAEERFEKETRLTLFGALQHSRTSDMDIRLDMPPVPSNIDVTGLSFRVPSCLDQSDDEGFQSASNMTPDSQSETSPVPDVDIWEALSTFEHGRRRCWESVGCPPGKRESFYVSEGGREAFDQLYRLWEGEMRVVSTGTPSPILLLPQDSQTQLVSDLLNVLIGVASTTFPLNQSVQFDVRPGVCVSGASPESVSRLLGELAQYGTYYLRLSRFSLQSADKKGLVFQAFTGGLSKYLHYYRACVLTTPPTLSLLTIGFLFFCNIIMSALVSPQGVKLLSYLYSEAQNNCSNENYPVLLSLLKSSCEPYTRFVSDWVYSGVFRDVYGEFMIQVNEEYLSFRDKHFWVQGYTLISEDVEDCVPAFLRHIANDVYVCGKTINLLKICCPQHYICWSEVPVPRIAVTFSLQEVEEIERGCAVYRGRMERIAKHSAVSREEKCATASKLKAVMYVCLCICEQWRNAAKKKQEEDDFSFARELRDREKRLQALEEQLEQRARKELIAQYSRLSEDAARRERRALWRVQRMRLSQARAHFFMLDRQKIQKCGQIPTSCLRRLPPQEEQSAETVPPPQGSSTAEAALISEDVDIGDLLPKSPKPDSQQVDKALEGIGSDLPEAGPAAHLVEYDFNDKHPGGHTALIRCSDDGKPLEANNQLHSSEAPDKAAEGISLSDIKSSVSTACVIDVCQSSFHGHYSDAHIKTRHYVSEVAAPSPDVHGHASDSRIKIGENVSGASAPPPSSRTHRHSSDAHIKIGENVSEFVPRLPTPNVHGHVSEAHIKVGELVSDITASLLPPSVHGHISDSHIKVGDNASDFVSLRPAPSIHGHSSDAHITVGEFVSNVSEARPRLSKHGHVSDCSLQPGCVVSGAEPPSSALPGSSYGHSSDSALGCGSPTEQLVEGTGCWMSGSVLSPGEKSEQEYLMALASRYQVEHYEDCYNLMSEWKMCYWLTLVTRGPWGLPVDPTLRRATDTTAVHLSEMVSLPVLIKHSVTAPLITHVSLVNKAAVDYFFVGLGVERHFEALRHFLLMEDGEFAQSLSDLIFEKMGSGQTPGELLTPLVLNSILSKALQYSLHGDTPLASNFTFALRFLPQTFHPHAPDSLNCLELRYKVDWPLNIIITDSCMNKYNRLFSFLLQLKHMVWSLRDVWFHLKKTALVKGAGRSVQFRQLQLYRHEMQHFVKVIQGYITSQILQVSWTEFTAKLATANDLDAIHRTHADYLNRAIFRGLLTEKAAPVMNIIHSIFSLILKFRAQLIAQPWGNQQGEAVHPSFIAMQQSYNTFKYYSHFLFKVVTKLVNRGYQPHLEDFLLRINFNNYYKDS
uniref:Tubulin gamma complex component 6 n=1 Tax=Nothobranchius furzeri TaxID=105023 RepID=A0A8C6Q744_NOTFU